MQVNIITDQTGAVPNFDNVLLSNENISSIPDSACTHVRLDNVIDFMSDQQVATLLNKVRHNGVVEVKSVDATTVISQMHIGSIPFEEGAPMLSSGKARLTSAALIKQALEQRGFVVEFAAVSKTEYRVVAKRS